MTTPQLVLSDVNPSFASLAAESLRVLLAGQVPTDRVEEAVERVMSELASLEVHEDVETTSLRHLAEQLAGFRPCL